MMNNHATVTNHPDERRDGLTSRQPRSWEQALIAAAQAGMAGAMNELLTRHKKALYRAARRFTRSHEDAEDLVQDAMLRAFVNVGKFRNESQFGTWLIAIVNNAALSKRRKEKNAYFVSMDSNREEASGPRRWDIPDVRSNPEEEIMHHELLAFLHEVLVRQSRTHQIILKRCVFDEVRIADTASSLGITIGSAKSSLYRARRRVSDSFARRGLVNGGNLQNTRARGQSV